MRLWPAIGSEPTAAASGDWSFAARFRSERLRRSLESGYQCGPLRAGPRWMADPSSAILRHRQSNQAGRHRLRVRPGSPASGTELMEGR
jgi:hypothetical protein